ncbi:MAG: radical SAM protein [Chloroflexi bacterium]|nr:radical SAM protein [Chloroflexota bacterium]
MVISDILEPKYLALYRTGELEQRARRLEARLAACDICPRCCGVNRLEDQRDFCRSGRLPIVASFCDHHGEEPALSGTKGSGAIFFGNCNLRCVYCQNHQISQAAGRTRGKETDCRTLAERMLFLQDELECHNINLVSPSHFVPQFVRALVEAVPMGLRIPLVYNTNAYDSLATLKELDGVIDIYLPDLKYASDIEARKFSQADEYVKHARAAVAEMYRQVGDLLTDLNGVARTGMVLRHLILPNNIAGSADSLLWLARELSPGIAVSIMAQYLPRHRAMRVPRLSRPITEKEYREVVELVEELGFENGWVQELTSADNYLPDFERQGHPFRR